MTILQWVKSGSTGTEQDYKITSNGTFETEELSPESENVTVNAAAYDASGNVVSATVGTITISASPIKGQWLAAPSKGSNVISLVDAGQDATYSMPLYMGPVNGIKAVIADVDFNQVDHIKIRVWGR